VTLATFTLVGLAAGAAAVSIALLVRARRAVGGDPHPPVLVMGALLGLVLAFVDHGAVLSWSLGVGAGDERTLLPGVGVLLGVALLAATGGSLLLGARLAVPAAEGARRAATVALWVAVAAGGLGAGLAAVRLGSLSGPLREVGVFPLALIAASTMGLALMLLATSAPIPSDASHEAARAGLAARVALTLTVVAAAACGLEGWWRTGTYATAATAAASSAALIGLAAMEAPGRFGLILRGLLVVALLGVLAP
jgi:hypothetical protein